MSIKSEPNKKSWHGLMLISIFAVLFVPVLYSGIYLSAFWDPYGHFNNVPVAFVNLDKPVVKDGKEYHIGKDIEDNLKQNTKVGWKFVSYEDAQAGVRGSDYYAAIIVPADFSQKISESTGDKLIKPTLLYEANKGKNFVFAQVSERAAESIKTEIASHVQESTTKALAGSLYDVKASLLYASEGANTLQNGTAKLADGAKQLSAGLDTAAKGTNRLQDGLRQAAGGESQILTGFDTLIGGLNKFKTGLTANTGSVAPLVSGAKSLADGMSAFNSGLEKANLPQGLTSAADSVGQVKAALGQASALLASSGDQQSVDQARAILAQVVNNLDSQDLEGRLRAAATGAGTLAANANQLSGAAQQVAGGTSKLAGSLATSQADAAAGADQLIAGVNRLKSGSTDILGGLNTAVAKTGELTSGLNVLNTGAVDLSNGMRAANDGSIKLKDGLNSGYNTMANNLKFNVEDMAKFVTNPLTLSDVSINDVNYYGEGLAPYFISLSLWLGAMLMNLILSLSRFAKTAQHKFLKTYPGSFLAGAILVMLQALILSLVLIGGLGLEPANPLAFFLGNMFIAAVFFSIMFGATYAFGFIATPVVFVLFILQLASSGGTFPIETAPWFFRTVSPFFPMTYTVEGLRMVIGGISYPRFTNIAIILVCFLLSFLAGGYLVDRYLKGPRKLKAEAE